MHALIAVLLAPTLVQERISVESEVGAIAFSPDSEVLTVGCAKKGVTHWAWKERRCLGTHSRASDTVNTISFLPDGKSYVTANLASIQVWEYATGDELRKFEGSGKGIYPTVLALSPDGKLIASNHGWKIWVRELDTGKKVMEAESTFHVTSLAFTPDGKSIASADGYGAVYVWDVATGKNTVAFENSLGSYILLTPDGKNLISWSRLIPEVQMWEIASRSRIRSWNVPDKEVSSLAISPDGRTIATAFQTVRLWDPTTGRAIREFSGHSGDGTCLAFAPSGETLASGGKDGNVFLWNLLSPAQDWSGLASRDLNPISLSTEGDIRDLAFSPDGKTLASTAKDLRVWDVAEKKPIRIVKDYPTAFGTLRFRQDGSLLFFGRDHSKKAAYLWDVSSGKELLAVSDATGVELALSPDLQKAVTTEIDGDIFVWDVATGKKITTLMGHKSFINRLTFSPDGMRLASGDYTQDVRVWDLEGGKELRDLGRHMGMGFTFLPDGKRLAVGSDKGAALLFEIDSSAEPISLENDSGSVDALAFSSDGGLLVVCAGRKITFWDWEHGKTVRSVERLSKGDWGEIRLLLFSPDGKKLASAGSNQIRVWSLRD